jgi:hypothetical protein
MNRAAIFAVVGPLALLGMAAGAGGCIGDIGGPQGTGTAEGTLCAVDTPVRRLTRFEYDNTVRDLLGDTTQPASSFPPEEEVQGFNNQSGAHTVSEYLAEQYMKAAEDLSATAVLDLDTLMPGCDVASEGNDACALHFIQTFGKRAYRRPLAQEEIDAQKALFDWALGDPDLGSFQDGIELVIQSFLQSPHFLYRPEFGSGEPIELDVVQLSHWELASKLSYMLWNTMPDDALFGAAEAGQLGTKEELAAQARRMLADPKAKDAIRNFHTQWLLLSHIGTISKDATIYPDYNDELRPLWQEEISQFIEYVILQDDATLKTLFSAPYSFLNADLAAFYGPDVVGAAPGGSEFVKTDLDPNHRAGLLTQGGLMATLAKGDRSSPVYRGKFVREQLMCDAISPPPADLIIVPPPLDSTKTTREQFEELANNADCVSCHSLMNPIGFGFEHYDAIGRWRDEQNGKPIDATGDIVGGGELAGGFDGAIELATKMAQSRDVAQCVASQWFRFANNRSLTPEDSCSKHTVYEAFEASGYNIRELLVALTQTDAFLYRHVVVPAGGAQ